MPAPVRSNSSNAPRPCAECRRLKHKCDKQVPCSPCAARGCQDICPDGTNATGEGHRRFWARTGEFKENLGQLARRVQDLEEALQSAQNLISTAEHPLLEESLMHLKDPFLSPEDFARWEKSRSGTPEHLIATVGSLSITQHGRVKYIGPGSLIDNYAKNDADHAKRSALQELPADVPLAAAVFISAIFGTITHQTAMQDRFATLRCYLPPPDEARRAINMYIRHCTHLINYVPDHDIDFAFQAVYYDYSCFVGREEEPRTHQLHAIIYLVLANGALFDPSYPSGGVEAAKFYELGCYALTSTRLIEAPTVEGIQALGLMARYKRHCKVPHPDDFVNLEWAVLGMISKIAYTFGLHRDPEHFGLSPSEQHRRRHLFWNIQSHEILAGCNWSLPHNISLNCCDTKLPEEEPNSARDIIDAWKYKFIRNCVAPIQEELLAAKPLTYDRVLALDTKLRSYDIPPLLKYKAPIPAKHVAESASIAWRRAFFAVLIHCLTLQLHRSYWVIATQEHASDPLGSPYGPSVGIALRSASALLAIVDTTYEYMVFPATRFNCGIEAINIGMTTLASIVARCPALPTATDALKQIERTHVAAARYWGAHGGGHGILMRMRALRDIARAVHTAHVAPAGAQTLRPTAEQIEAVLAVPAFAENGADNGDLADSVPFGTETFFGPTPDNIEWPPAYGGIDSRMD